MKVLETSLWKRLLSEKLGFKSIGEHLRAKRLVSEKLGFKSIRKYQPCKDGICLRN
jgi:hypothetical protein